MKPENRTRSVLSMCALAVTLAFAVTANATDIRKIERNAPGTLQAADLNAPATSAAIVRDPLAKLLFGQSAALRGGGVCGNSEPDIGEECDDGNTTGGDGCDATCLLEAGATCTAAVPGDFFLNSILNGGFEEGDANWTESGVPFPPICNVGLCGADLAADGEGYYWSGGSTSAATTTSALQTGVTIPTDATSLELDIFRAFCTPEGGSGDRVTVEIDGFVVYSSGATCNEDADYVTEAVPVPGPLKDGLSNHTVEIIGVMDFVDGHSGNIWVDNVKINSPRAVPIPPVPSACKNALCGDGIVDAGETCDDGNTTDLDGCAATCGVEDTTHLCADGDDALGVLTGSLDSGEDLFNGSVEDDAAGWAVSADEPGVTRDPVCSEALCPAFISENDPLLALDFASHGGNFLWMGAVAETSIQFIEQDVALDPLATSLTWQQWTLSCDSAQDVVRVRIDGAIVAEEFCTGTSSTYVEKVADISAFAGSTVTLRLEGEFFNVSGNSNIFIDELSVAYAVPGGRPVEPSTCFELDPVCEGMRGPGSLGIMKFEAGIPGDWTVIATGNLPGPDGADDYGWGTTNDGVCGAPEANWPDATDLPGGNTTGGEGEAACADSDGAAELLAVDALGGGLSGDEPDGIPDCIQQGGSITDCQVNTYLCTPAIDTTGSGKSMSWDHNYQTGIQDFETDYDGDLDFFDNDEVFRLLVGDAAPSVLNINNELVYRNLGELLDSTSGSLDFSGPQSFSLNLDVLRDDPELALANPVHICFHYAGVFSWYAQVDNVAVRASGSCTVGDTDGDLVNDDVDNCIDAANALQIDTDGDGHGNACDFDYDNDCEASFADLNTLKLAFFTSEGDPGYNPDIDSDGDGQIGFADLNGLKLAFFQPPGPSASPALCNLP